MRRYNCTLSQWWSRAVQGIFQSGFQLVALITFAENHGIGARNFGSFPQSTGQARNALAEAEIYFADRKQKVETQPALRLVHSKQNHLAINYSLLTFTNTASIPVARELLCDPRSFC